MCAHAAQEHARILHSTATPSDTGANEVVRLSRFPSASSTPSPNKSWPSQPQASRNSALLSVRIPYRLFNQFMQEFARTNSRAARSSKPLGDLLDIITSNLNDSTATSRRHRPRELSALLQAQIRGRHSCRIVGKNFSCSARHIPGCHSAARRKVRKTASA